MMHSEGPSPILNSTLSDQIYSVIQEWIFSGKLPMGERLDFGELERELSVSRTPLNEAVARLESDGLIISVPRRGKYVVSIHQDDVKQRYEIRQILETGAAKQIVAKLTPEKCAQVEALSKRMRAQHAQNEAFSDYVEFIKLDAEFHRKIMSIADSPLLLEIYGGLLLHLQLASIFISLKEKRIRASIEEHERIVAALKSSEVDRFKQACIMHLANSKQAILDRMQALEQGAEL